MKRFRFSLLSLLVGVVLAGGMLWLNVGTPFWIITSQADVDLSQRYYGWPLHAYVEYVAQTPRSLNRWYHYRWPGLAANIAIGLAIVFGGAAVCEYVVRRRVKKAKE